MTVRERFHHLLVDLLRTLSRTIYYSQHLTLYLITFSIMAKISVLSLAVWVSTASAFSPMATQFSASTTQLSMANEADSRRSFFSKAAGSAAVAAFSLVQAPGPAQALGGGLKKVNAKLVQ